MMIKLEMVLTFMSYCFIVQLTVIESRQYFIKENDIPSYLYRKFENLQEQIFPRMITIEVAFSTVTGILFYSMDKNMNQLIVNMRDDMYNSDTRFAIQIELNTQYISVSLSKLCGREGSLFDERSILTLGMVLDDDYLIISCTAGTQQKFRNEKLRKLNHAYPIMYTEADSESVKPNEAHMWLVNHPMIGSADSFYRQMSGCIFNVVYYGELVTFTNVTSNVGDKCPVSCRDDKCNGGECSVIYSEEVICNCTKAFFSGNLCNDEIGPMNFRTASQTFDFIMFKLSWKTTSTSLLTLKNRDIYILLGTEKSKIFFRYDFMNYERKNTTITLSEEYTPNTESICIVYFHQNMTNIRIYTSLKWNSIWIPSIFDMRKATIDWMEFRSGNGNMSLVFKISPEYQWIPVRFKKMLPLKKEYSYNLAAILGPTFCVIAAASISIYCFILRKQRKKMKRKLGTYWYDQIGSGAMTITEYISHCKEEIGWNIAGRNRTDFLRWKDYIVHQSGSDSLEDARLEIIHRLIRDGFDDKEYFSTYIIVLFIYTRIFVLPSMGVHTNMESLSDAYPSIKNLISLLRDKYKYPLCEHMYFAQCIIDFLEDVSEEYRTNKSIHPLLDSIIEYLAHCVIIYEHQCNIEVSNFGAYLTGNTITPVWMAAILSGYEINDGFKTIMRQYLSQELKYKVICDDAVIVYLAMIQSSANNKDPNYEFTALDLKFIASLYDIKMTNWNITKYIKKYIINIYDNICRDEGLLHLQIGALTDAHKIAITCLHTSLLNYKPSEDNSAAILLVSFLDQLYAYVSQSVIATRMAETILYYLCQCASSIISIPWVLDTCVKYATNRNLSEEIRLSTSIICCADRHNAAKLCDMSYIHSFISNIQDDMKLQGRSTYLGFASNDIQSALLKFNLDVEQFTHLIILPL